MDEPVSHKRHLKSFISTTGDVPTGMYHVELLPHLLFFNSSPFLMKENEPIQPFLHYRL